MVLAKFLIQAVTNLLNEQCKACSYFGIAAFNIKGTTLHSLLQLPIRGKRKGPLKSSRARDGNSSLEDWNLFLSRTLQSVNNITHFETSAVKLSFGNEKVATDNCTRLKQLGEPIVQISAYHPNAKAKNLGAEDMGGLEPIIYLAKKLELC